jgi:hypothetical protein
MTVEADLCTELNISLADARELASYARGKLNIIPGDTMAEQIHRQSIFTTAMEADKQFPRKRNVPSTNGREPERNNQNFDNPEQSNTPECHEHELVMAVQDASSPTSNIMMDRGNAKVGNEAVKADGTTKTKTDESGWIACLACLDCLNCLGHCCMIFSAC